MRKIFLLYGLVAIILFTASFIYFSRARDKKVFDNGLRSEPLNASFAILIDRINKCFGIKTTPVYMFHDSEIFILENLLTNLDSITGIIQKQCLSGGKKKKCKCR